MKPNLFWARPIALLTAVFVMAVSPAHAEIRAVEPKTPPALPAFELKDQHGKAFTQESLKGHWTLSLIGFTHCPDVCPFVLSNLAAVVSQMSVWVRPDNLPKVVFVGVDPGRDHGLLGEYVNHFNKNFLGVTGSHAELAKFVEGIDGFYRLGKPDKDGVYDVQHSASVIVTGPDGRIYSKLSPPLKPNDVAQYLARKQIAFRRNLSN